MFAVHAKTTLAGRLGTTVHRSLLLHKLRVAGLDTAEKIATAAIARGLPYYAPHGGVVQPHTMLPVTTPELAIALVHPSLPWDPQRIRLAAALLGTRGLKAGEVARVTRQERAQSVVREIAKAGTTAEPDDIFWRELLFALPECSPPPAGVMPHPSRFMAISGRARPGHKPASMWIRPMASA